jgi:hypothetical protein
VGYVHEFFTNLNFIANVSSCWHNLVSKMVIKSVVVRMQRKAIRTLEEFYFSREPRLQSHLQARLDELDKQEFLRASSVVSYLYRRLCFFVLRLLLERSYLEF